MKVGTFQPHDEKNQEPKEIAGDFNYEELSYEIVCRQNKLDKEYRKLRETFLIVK